MELPPYCLLTLSVPGRAQDLPFIYSLKNEQYATISPLDSVPANRKVKNPEKWRICKVQDFFFVIIPTKDTAINSVRFPFQEMPPLVERPKLLTLTGNIMYDVNYRSRIDTPYAENNLYQHSVQTHLDLLYKNQYPFRVYLTTRVSNSSMFRKYTDLNFQFNSVDFSRMVKNRIISAIESYALSNNK